MQPVSTSGVSAAETANMADQKPPKASYYIAALGALLPHKTEGELVDMFTHHMTCIVNEEAAKQQKCEAGEEGWKKYQSPEYDTLEKHALVRCLAKLEGGELSMQEFNHAPFLQVNLDFSKDKQGMLLISEQPYAIPLRKSPESGIWLATKRLPDGTDTAPQPLKDMLADLFPSGSLKATLCRWPEKRDWTPKPNAATIPEALRNNDRHAKEFRDYLDQARNTAPRTEQNEPSISTQLTATIAKEFGRFSQWAANKRYNLASCDMRTLNQLVDNYCQDEFPEHEHEPESLRSISLNAYLEWRSADQQRTIEQLKTSCADAMGELMKTFEQLHEKNRRENGGKTPSGPGLVSCTVM